MSGPSVTETLSHNLMFLKFSLHTPFLYLRFLLLSFFFFFLFFWCFLVSSSASSYSSCFPPMCVHVLSSFPSLFCFLLVRSSLLLLLLPPLHFFLFSFSVCMFFLFLFPWSSLCLCQPWLSCIGRCWPPSAGGHVCSAGVFLAVS